MRMGPIRRTDWLPVGDTVEGEQLDRGYDSQSEGSSAEEEAMRADPGYDEWDDYFPGDLKEDRAANGVEAELSR